YLYNQLKDFANAAKAGEAEIATGQVPDSELKGLKRTLVDLYFLSHQGPKGISAAKEYMAKYGADEKLLQAIANQAYADKDYAAAFDASEKMIRGSESAGSRPSEDALRIYMGSAFYLNKKDVYSSSLEKLVTYYPKAEYWVKLLDNLPLRQG